MGRGRGGAPPRGWWPSGLASVSLKRVVPGSAPPWRAPCFAWPRCGFLTARASIFVPLPWFSTSGQKHGSDALARLKRPCCGGAPFFFWRQARSSKLEAGKPLYLLLKRFARAVFSRTFSVKPLLPGLCSLRGKIRGFGPKSCFFLFAARPRTRLVSCFVGRRLRLLLSYVTLPRGARRSFFWRRVC